MFVAVVVAVLLIGGGGIAIAYGVATVTAFITGNQTGVERLTAEESGDDGPAWAASVAWLGNGVLQETTEVAELLDRARSAAGADAVDRALTAHRQRVG